MSRGDTMTLDNIKAEKDIGVMIQDDLTPSLKWQLSS